MAKATITISLTNEEAQTLFDITELIGGCPQKSRRRHTEAVREALKSVGIGLGTTADMKDESAIYFC